MVRLTGYFEWRGWCPRPADWIGMRVFTSIPPVLSFAVGTPHRVLRVDGLVSPTGGLDWYEGAIAKPAEVLADMAGALAAPASKVHSFIHHSVSVIL